MKKLILFLILLISMTGNAQQEKLSEYLFKVPQIIYFGIDFSHAQIISESPKHKKALHDSLLQKINLTFLSEQMEWLQSNLSKEIIIEDKLIHTLNSICSDTALIADNEDIQRILTGYPNINKTGTGLVFLVAYLYKPKKIVVLYPVFFDISSKTILWMDKESMISHGGAPGLMQYWYSKVFNSIRDFVDTYKSQKAEKNGTAKPNNIFLKMFVDEIDLGYERKVDPDLNISFEAGYRVNYINSWSYLGNILPVEYLYRFLCFYGPTFRLDLKFKISKQSYLGPVFGYQHLYSPEIIWNPGNFAGTDDEPYRVWNQHNDEFVIQLIHFVNLGHPPYLVQFFYGVGLKVCAFSEHYSIDGYPKYRTPSDKIINETILQPLITFGLSIKLGSF